MNFTEFEDQNGLRIPFSVLPTNKIDAASCNLPLGCLYTPMKPLAHQPCQYEPVRCHSCGGILNPYAQIDFEYKTWTCPLCKTRSNLPTSYHGMTAECLPAELHPSFKTVEYTIPSAQVLPPIFVFVVDTCSREAEHQHLKNLLVQTMGSLPQNAMVGFVTFGSIAYIHELKFSECPRSYVFNGIKTYPVEKMRELLSVTVNEANPFIVPIAEAEQMLTNVIDYLETDIPPSSKTARAERCTGAALDYAITMVNACFPGSNAQVILFTSGLITKGPGAMATTNKADLVRQHRDIDAGKAAMTQTSIAYFETLKQRANDSNVVVNVITASFEETGLHELSTVVSATGGFMMSNESWSEEAIGKTLVKYFDGGVFENSGGDCRMSLQVTNQIKINGCIGPCSSTKRMNAQMVSEKVIGEGGTTEWKTCGMLPTTTFAFFFDIYASKTQPIPPGTMTYLQFVTKYRHLKTGTMRLRVTTAAVTFADLTEGKMNISNAFDQQAAAILVAKHSCWRVSHEDSVEVVHSIDGMLIRFCRVFGTYNKGDAASFSLGPNLGFLPQFLFHFRRSPFLAVFNATPDQTTCLRHSLMSEDTTNSLFMIQPTLMKYSLDAEPQPVILDLQSIDKSVVLMMDTFFKVVIWHGSQIVAWRKQGYHEQEEYRNLKSAMEDPLAEANELVAERFPTPTLIICDQGSSQERALLSRCNPSSVSSFDASYSGDNLGTDEPSYNTFVAKLKQMAVSTGKK